MFSTGIQRVKLSKSFHETCVKIGECKSREEEEIIVSQWMSNVKQTLGKSKISLSDLYENLISLIHLTLLGYNTNFGHIHAVNLTQDSQIMTKALGYLACAALFDSKSNLLILIINSTQRDLSSGEPIKMALALTAITHLVTPDLIPPILGYVSQCLNHTVPLVRQKAVMAVHSFVQKDPASVVEFFPDLVRLLLDPDISIVNAVVTTFSTLLKSTLNIRQICDAVPDVIRVADMIQQGQAKHEYYHQRVLAPFNLVNIFNLFRALAPHMPDLPQRVEPILSAALRSGTLECTASSSVLYEAIRTCIALNLLQIPQLKGAISLFMGSRDQNYKYIGLGLLQSLPDFADEFQSTVIDCLEHPDPSIRYRTLGLLHSMANEDNAQIIVVNMLRFFQRTKNDKIRTELADRITSIASKYSPSPLWFAKTMEQLFAIGGNLVNQKVAFDVIDLIENECDDETRRSIVNLYIDVAQSGQRLSDVFVTVISVILGKYATLSDEYDVEFVALLLCDLADLYPNSRDWVLDSLLRISVLLEEVPQAVHTVFESYKDSRNVRVQELCYESLALLNYPAVLHQIFEDDSPIDENLSFLDDFVRDAIAAGAPEYIPLEERDMDDDLGAKSTLRFAAYQPQVAGEGAEQEIEPETTGLNTTGIKNVWTEEGLTEYTEVDQETAQMHLEQAQQEEEKPAEKVNMFKKLSLKNKQPEKDIKKEKMAASLFGAKKGGLKKPSLAKPAAPAQPEYVQQPVVEEDDDVKAVREECSSPPPAEIAQFTEGTQAIPTYADNRMKVATFAKEGSIMVVVLNSGNETMNNVTISIEGADALLKESVSHPAEITLIPQGCAVSLLTKYRFPQTMPSFPEFKFKAVVKFNEDKTAAFDLPVDITTFIVPTKLTTPQFGGLWKQGGSEIILTIPRKPDYNLDRICEVIKSKLHIETVERIGTEEILAGQLHSTPLKVLVHIKQGPMKTDVKVLTKAQPMTQALIALLKPIFP